MRRGRPWKRCCAVLMLVALALGTGSCGKDKPNKPKSDVDGDGVVDASDNCPSEAGEAQYGGCPWYKIDVCSGSSPYALAPQKWSTLTPTFYYASSLPSSWRAYVDYAASTWNSAGSRLQIRKFSTVVSAGVANDGRSVVCYGPISSERLGETNTWYNTTTGFVTEADIKLNSNHPLTIGGSPTSYDVWSILTHEFGHFAGLKHVPDRTHTMYESMPMNCIIYRTLCAGDVLGLRRLYP